MTAFLTFLSRLISAAVSAFIRSSKSGTVSDSSALSFSYISSVLVSVIIYFVLTNPLQTHVKYPRRMRQRADRDVIDPGLRDFEYVLERNVAGRLEICPPIGNFHGLTHRLGRDRKSTRLNSSH